MQKILYPSLILCNIYYNRIFLYFPHPKSCKSVGINVLFYIKVWDKYGNYAERVKIMKRIAIITLCILFLFLLPGCIDKKVPSPDTPVTLNMWHVYGSQTTSPLNDAIDEFNKSVGMENGIVINVVSARPQLIRLLNHQPKENRVQISFPTFLQHIRELPKLSARISFLHGMTILRKMSLQPSTRNL